MTKKTRFNQLRYLPSVFKLVWGVTKGWTIAWVVLLLVQSLLPLLTIYLTRELVNTAATLVREGWQSPTLQSVLIIGVLLGVLQIATALLSSLVIWVKTAQSDIVRDHISSLIQSKAVALDMSFYDSADYYDLLHRVRSDARQTPISLLQNIASLLQSGLTLLGMMAILVSYSVILPPVLFLSTLPGLWVLLKYSRRYNRWRLENTSRDRLSLYYDLLLTERDSAPEIRLFSLGAFYQHAYETIRTRMRVDRLIMNRDKMLSGLLATAVALLVAGGALLWMGWHIVQGLASLGDLAVFYQIFQTGQSLMQALMQNAGSIYESTLFVGDLFDFLELEPHVMASEQSLKTLPPLHESIEFENVSFRYPGSDRYALKDFSMTIPAGKIVALVGENGMGKTTLMKLLCRLYDPAEGRVLWDGQDLHDVAPDALHRQITMLFQEPYNYQETARHNIAVGDLSANPTLSAIEAAARAAEADELIRKLPKQYESMLGKWFGGEELSVGQWQRVALARALIRQASLIILDEPTSAMDAWAETSWLNHMREITNGRTLIMITHRFTTAMHADLIYVLHENQLIEQGTHESLLAQGKRYAESWRDQMRHMDVEEG